MTERPRLLPLLGPAGHSARDAMTCLYRCGNACDHPVPNESANPYLGHVVSNGVTRRGLVRAGAGGARVLGIGGAVASAAPPAMAPPATADAPVPELLGNLKKGKAGALGFKPIPPNKLDTVIVPNGYDHAVVMRWGDPVLPGAPGLDVHKQSPER